MKYLKDNFGRIIALTIIVFTTYWFVCCSNKKTEKSPTKTEKINSAYKSAEWELEDEKEKIVLLSIISKTPVDSLHLILKEYYSKDTDNKGYKYLDKFLDTVSAKFKMPKYKISTLIYRFKYGMKTDEDIINEGLESLEQESNYEYENNGRGY